MICENQFHGRCFGAGGGDQEQQPEEQAQVVDHAASSSSKSHKLSDEATSKILNQVEYYFSDLNLATTDHLMRFIHKDPDRFVPISVVASFKKIKALINSHSQLATVLRNSSKLVVNEDGKKVRPPASPDSVRYGRIANAHGGTSCTSSSVVYINKLQELPLTICRFNKKASGNSVVAVGYIMKPSREEDFAKRGAFPMYPTQNGQMFIPLTFELPLSPQLQEVDVLLHKVTDEIMSVDLSSSLHPSNKITYSRGMQELQIYMEHHQDLCVIDPLKSIYPVLDRLQIQEILLGLEDLKTAGCCAIWGPHFLKALFPYHIVLFVIGEWHQCQTAILKIQGTSEHLTPLHPEFLVLCFLSKSYKDGFSILDEDIFTVDLFLYCYYGGMICIGQKRWRKALELLHNVVTAPMSVISA